MGPNHSVKLLQYCVPDTLIKPVYLSLQSLIPYSYVHGGSHFFFRSKTINRGAALRFQFEIMDKCCLSI